MRTREDMEKEIIEAGATSPATPVETGKAKKPAKEKKVITEKSYDYFAITKSLPDNCVITYNFGDGVSFKGTKAEIVERLEKAGLYINTKSYLEKGVYTCRVLNGTLYNALKDLYTGSVDMSEKYPSEEQKAAKKEQDKKDKEEAKAKIKAEKEEARAKAKAEKDAAKAKIKEEKEAAKAKDKNESEAPIAE